MERIIILFLLTLYSYRSSAQENPLDYVDFYSVEALDFSVFAEPEFQKYYNKTYDGNAYLKQYFQVWDNIEIGSLTDKEWNTYFKYQDLSVKSPCFGGNYQAHSDELISQLTDNLPDRKEQFPHFTALGITTGTLNLRKWPTEEFCFKSVRGAGESYPFDYSQESLLWVGVPVKILSQTKDGLWYFVDSPNNRGWVQSDKVAMVKPKQAQAIKAMSFATILKDNTVAKKGVNAVQLNIGVLLPMLEKKNKKHLLIPHRSFSDGHLHFDTVAITSPNIKAFPIVFDSTNVKLILSDVFGTKYSWGGLGGGRDCSSTLQDYLTPFGIRLPRNSVQQYRSGKQVDLSGDPGEKYKTIKAEGVPFLSSLYKRGHIMLYVGENKNGMPLIYHTVWGLKSFYQDEHLAEVAEHKAAFGLFGLSDRNFFNDEVQTRIIIAKTVITTMEPGKKLNAFEKLRIDMIIEHIHTLTLFAD
jgi:hypothetical protein